MKLSRGLLAALLLGLAAASISPTDQVDRRLLKPEAGGCDSTCTVRVGSVRRTYCRCIVAGKGNMEIFWDFPANASSMDIAFASARGRLPAGEQQYIALGFPETPGMMVPADAVVAQLDGKEATGAVGVQYYLAGYSGSMVGLQDGLELDALSAGASGGDRLACSFTLYPSGDADMEGDTMPVIVAGGVLVDGGAKIGGHRFRGDADLALRPGAESQVDHADHSGHHH